MASRCGLSVWPGARISERRLGVASGLAWNRDLVLGDISVPLNSKSGCPALIFRAVCPHFGFEISNEYHREDCGPYDGDESSGSPHPYPNAPAKT